MALKKAILRLPIDYNGQPFLRDREEDVESVETLLRFVIKYHPSVRAETLALAFEQASAKVLLSNGQVIPVDLWGKRLISDKIGTVLMAFAEANKNKQRLNQLASRTPSEPFIQPTGEEMYQSMLVILSEEGNLPIAHPWELIHGYMVKEGMLQPLPPVKEVPAIVKRRGLEHLIGELQGHDRFKAAIKSHFVSIGVIEKQTA